MKNIANNKSEWNSTKKKAEELFMYEVCNKRSDIGEECSFYTEFMCFACNLYFEYTSDIYTRFFMSYKL